MQNMSVFFLLFRDFSDICVYDRLIYYGKLLQWLRTVKVMTEGNISERIFLLIWFQLLAYDENTDILCNLQSADWSFYLDATTVWNRCIFQCLASTCTFRFDFVESAMLKPFATHVQHCWNVLKRCSQTHL